MKAVFNTPGVKVAIALLAGFLGGSYFTGQSMSGKKDVDGVPPEPRSEVKTFRRNEGTLPDARSRNLNVEDEQKLGEHESPLSHQLRPRSEEIQISETVHEISPDLMNRLTNGEYVLQFELVRTVQAAGVGAQKPFRPDSIAVSRQRDENDWA